MKTCKHKNYIVVQEVFTIPKRNENWLGRQDSKLQMPTLETGALPHGDAPMAEYLGLFFEKFKKWVSEYDGFVTKYFFYYGFFFLNTKFVRNIFNVIIIPVRIIK